ncbi:hypothetical protein HNR46_003488 [Haloferula luteola]|uniref:Uncharacterized protein n=1 Tax=Haloferula luteola TaxID=595692 RepID=A0A840V6F7_9BACT|nr:SRPBCC family protein [Haloferula luteola]MBB5353233.1 hypothetical protein [Haloferula luteola]
MRIQTAITIPASPEQLWPLLTRSSMNLPGCFCLGLPQPLSCELPDSEGGVGSIRHCHSDRGHIIQRITEWSPPSRLTFEMVSTDHCWAHQVQSLRETFHIIPLSHGLRVTRSTQLKATSPFSLIKEWGFSLGLKRIHFYVFKNWKSQLSLSPPVSSPSPNSTHGTLQNPPISFTKRDLQDHE